MVEVLQKGGEKEGHSWLHSSPRFSVVVETPLKGTEEEEEVLHVSKMRQAPPTRAGQAHPDLSILSIEVSVID